MALARELGQRSGLYSEIHQPFGGEGRYYLQAFGLYEATRQPAEVLGLRIAEFTRREFLGGGEIGLYPNPRWQLSAGLQHGRRQLRRAIGSTDIQRTNNANLASVVLAATYDTLDDVGFPTRGGRFDIAQQFFRPGLVQTTTPMCCACAPICRLRWSRSRCCSVCAPTGRWQASMPMNR